MYLPTHYPNKHMYTWSARLWPSHKHARVFYPSNMGVCLEVLEERKESPLLELLDRLGGWPIINSNWEQSDFDWLELMAQLRLYNNDILISEWVGPDIKNSDEYVIQVCMAKLQ